MNLSDQLEERGDYAVFRLNAILSLAEAIGMVTDAIAAARARKIRKLLIDTSGLTGFKSPSVVHRYSMVHEWAAAADGVVRVAMIARPEMIDPSKFGVTVANNIGFISDVFISEEEALGWLAGQ